jgi:hypothetical protein
MNNMLGVVLIQYPYLGQSSLCRLPTVIYVAVKIYCDDLC